MGLHCLPIYAQTGDLFAWLCIAGFVIIIITAVCRKYFTRLSSLSKKENVSKKMKISFHRE